MQIYADPRTALTMTTPLDDRCRFLATELLHSFGIPALGPFGGTDAEAPGTWLAGVETMLQLLQVPLDGCELYTGIGLTNTYQLFTPENLILDDDLYHRARHAFLDIPMDEESLALDVIDAVGPGGHFLAQPHTRRHMRDAVAARGEPGDRPGRAALPRPGRGRARARPRHPRATTGRSRWPTTCAASCGASSTRRTRRSRGSRPRSDGRRRTRRGGALASAPPLASVRPRAGAGDRRRRRRAPARSVGVGAGVGGAGAATSLTVPSGTPSAR